CGRICPDGGILSQDCSVCTCEGVVLHGRVATTDGFPLANTSVYLKTRMWDAIGSTDTLGFFNIQDICPRNTILVFKKTQFIDITRPIQRQNATHHGVQVKMERA
ncbi:unnamed protein product, partial [Owenia fusiformis]